jgi:DNA-binding GntR family transcriptional regulator
MTRETALPDAAAARPREPSVVISDRRKMIDTLKKEIATGLLKPGQRLVEAQLSQRFGLKRNGVREVLRMLAQDHFVTLTPNVGAIVPELSQKEIEQTYDLISVLDGLACRLAASFTTAAQLEDASVEGLVDKMDVVDDVAMFARYNFKFHSVLATMSGNDMLIKLASDLRLRLGLVGYLSFTGPHQIKASRIEHRKILNAIKEANPDRAEKLMRSHILDAKNRLVKYLSRSL